MCSIQTLSLKSVSGLFMWPSNVPHQFTYDDIILNGVKAFFVAYCVLITVTFI